MRSLMIVSTLLIFAASCSPTRTPTAPAPEPSATSEAAGPSPSASMSPTQAVSTAPAQAVTGAAPVTLEVLTPQDNAVVNTAQVLVSGRASPDAVATVNDDILIVGADGLFQDTVTLDEGLNLIEVIASNTSGSEASAEITVTYEP